VVTPPTRTVPVVVCLDEAEAGDRLARDARDALTAVPKDLPPKWFYDERGSELFEAITELDEYYPTRAERQILRSHSADIAAMARPETLVELGSGSASKTRILLDALVPAGTGRYVAFDVCEPFVRQYGSDVSVDYPGLQVEGVVGDFEHHLDRIPHHGRQLVAFLGGTVGNLVPTRRRRFLRALRGVLDPGEHLLLGADLIKDTRRLVAAYDDRAGVTAEFNRNVLRVLNGQLGADFDPAAFSHVAVWDAANDRIEMRLRSRRHQKVRLATIDLEVEFGEGEEMRTEVSSKFRPAGLAAELEAAAMEVAAWWTDDAGDYSLFLARAV
jgi:L-histidine N-alpha-methyltransferase